MEVLNQQSPIVIVKSTDNDITLKYKHASHPKKRKFPFNKMCWVQTFVLRIQK